MPTEMVMPIGVLKLTYQLYFTLSSFFLAAPPNIGFGKLLDLDLYLYNVKTKLEIKKDD